MILEPIDFERFSSDELKPEEAEGLGVTKLGRFDSAASLD